MSNKIPYNSECVDPEITISFGKNREDTNWKPTFISWAEFVKRIGEIRRTEETMAVYDLMAKPKQGLAKDGPGYVGGTVTGGNRTKRNTEDRWLITLDIDHYGEDFYFEHSPMFGSPYLGYIAYALHPTHSHRDHAQKYRLIIPADRAMLPDEYAAVTRKLAEMIGMRFLDKTTFDIERLMYFPSCSADAPGTVPEVNEGAAVNVDGVLAMYADWKDGDSWPRHPDETRAFTQHFGNLGDPREKNNKIIAAFNTAYDIHLSIETYLQDKYEQVTDNRYTFKEGSASGGMRVYADRLDPSYDAWAYSEHQSDPANTGHCMNSFDLVRVHKFGDDEKATDAMLGLAANDPEVKLIIADMRQAELEEFGDMSDESEDWESKLELNSKTGAVKTNSRNTQLILMNKPFNGALAYDAFKNTEVIREGLPWREREREDLPYEPWLGSDDRELRHYFSYHYDIKAANMIMDSFTHAVRRNKFHPIKDYLEGLRWDGVQRLDSLFIDYLGAESSDYVKAVTRKMFVAAIKRVYQPGCKFDEVLVIVGPQGCGKSTVIAKMGRQWFSDSLKSFDSKEAGEYLQNSWIFEFAELAHMKKAAVEEIKAFTSKTTDMYRVAYDRVVSEFPRKCIFFGTTNNFNFLKDDTGNRRFWPIVAAPGKRTRSPFTGLTENEVGQLWAEAKRIYDQGESVTLSSKMSKAAEVIQGQHMEDDPRAGLIAEYLDTPIQEGYDEPVERTKVCAVEIWVECLGNRKGDMKPYEAKAIRDILRNMPGWKECKQRRFKTYGPQHSFERELEILT